MADDYIRRQAAIDIVVFECGKWTGLAKEISKQLKQLLATDVVPVVHGKWTKLSYDGFNCNECGSTFVIMQGRENMHFCPNCGAKMDAG